MKVMESSAAAVAAVVPWAGGADCSPVLTVTN